MTRQHKPTRKELAEIVFSTVSHPQHTGRVWTPEELAELLDGFTAPDGRDFAPVNPWDLWDVARTLTGRMVRLDHNARTIRYVGAMSA